MCALTLEKLRSTTVNKKSMPVGRGIGVLRGTLGSREDLLAQRVSGPTRAVPRTFAPCGRILRVCSGKLRLPSSIAVV